MSDENGSYTSSAGGTPTGPSPFGTPDRSSMGNKSQTNNTSQNNRSSSAPPPDLGLQSTSIVAKVVLLGDSGVGKSSLVVRYVEGVFSNVVKSTIGASFFTKRLTVNGAKVKLQIWDTAGQERFRSLAPMFYRGAAAAIVVFDITNEASFEKLKSWVTELRTNVEDNLVICIAANKQDLSSERRVASNKVIDYAESIGATVFETSARINSGVEEMFASVANNLVTQHALSMQKGATGNGGGPANSLPQRNSPAGGQVNLENKTKPKEEESSCCS